MRKSVLIIEDERDRFNDLKKSLNELNYDVFPKDFDELLPPLYEPINGEQIDGFAIRQIKEHLDSLRLVICDINLGAEIKGGNRVVRTIRGDEDINPVFTSMIPIIAITQYAERQVRIIEVGADYSVVKEQIDSNPDVFKAIIESQIERFDKNLKLLHVLKDKNKVFIVHGHDEDVREQVANFLRDLGLTAIILHEQPNSGATIIEKIERYTDVAYAVVLYTACDIGKDKNEKDYKPRARQNVVFEHGYMMSKLGRNNVCALVGDKAIELPGDMSGVVYVSFEDNSWKEKLVKEMRAQGVVFDMDKVISALSK